MQQFKSFDQMQRFLSAHRIIYGHFHLRPHLMTARDCRRSHGKTFRIWQQETYTHLTR